MRRRATIPDFTASAADLVAVEGDRLADVTALESVSFAMKGGAVVRND